MKFNEIRQYCVLEQNRLHLIAEIRRLEELQGVDISVYSSPSLDVCSGSGGASPTESIAIADMERSAEIKKRISEAQVELQDCENRLNAIDDFIASVADGETRMLLNRCGKERIAFRQMAMLIYTSKDYVRRKIFSVCEK